MSEAPPPPTLDRQLSSSAQRAALEAALSAADGELARAKAELARAASARVLGEQLEQLGLDELGILAERVSALSMIDTEAESEDHFRERLDDLLCARRRGGGRLSRPSRRCRPHVAEP